MLSKVAHQNHDKVVIILLILSHNHSFVPRGHEIVTLIMQYTLSHSFNRERLNDEILLTHSHSEHNSIAYIRFPRVQERRSTPMVLIREKQRRTTLIKHAVTPIV